MISSWVSKSGAMKILLVLFFACATLLASAVAILKIAKLPEDYIWYVVAALGAILVAVATVTLVRAVWNSVASRKEPSREDLDHAERVRALRRTLRQLDRHQRTTAPPRPWLLGVRYRGPWIAVLGLPGHGKSSLIGPLHPEKLVEINEQGPVADNPSPYEDRPRVLSVPGGAAFLEIPHALTSQVGLRRYWLSLLALLARRSQPLHGIVLCVAADEILAAPEMNSRAAEIGRSLAGSVHELADALRIRVPIYLVITRADRLAGFEDVLGTSAPTLPLGFELPDGHSDDYILKELRSRFASLCGYLERRVFKLISRGREQIPPRASLHTFPQQVHCLSAAISVIAGHLLAARGTESFRIRGVYLTSATQAAEPAVDAVLSALSERIGGLPVVGSSTKVLSRRLFCDDILSTLIVRGALLARRTSHLHRRSSLLRGGLGIGLLVSGIWVMAGTYSSTMNNRSLLAQASDMSWTLEAALADVRDSPIDPKKIASLRDLIMRWEDAEGEDRDEVRGWGLFRAELPGPLKSLYKRTVLKGVVQVLARKAESDLQLMVDKAWASDTLRDIRERQTARDNLRFYLLATGDKKPYEKSPCTEDLNFFRQELRRRWVAAASTPGKSSLHPDVDDEVQLFLDLLTDQDIDLSRDHDLIEKSQRILARVGSVREEVEEIVEKISIERKVPRITLRSLAEMSDLENSSTDVRGAFTLDGWVLVKAWFHKADESDVWVLGLDVDEAKARNRQREAELRSEYFIMYEQEWRRFVTRMKIVAPADLDKGVQLLRDLSRSSQEPLGLVFRELKRHTEIVDDFDVRTQGLLSLVSGSRAPNDTLKRAEDVSFAFSKLVAFSVASGGKESRLDRYHARLRELRDAVQRALDDKTQERALVEQVNAAINFTDTLVEDSDLGEFSGWVRKLLRTPLESLLRLLVHDQGAGIARNWCSRVVDLMHARFGGRYPFDPSSRSPVAIADFEEFFHPTDGVISKERDELLSGYVTLMGEHFELRDRGNAEGPQLDPSVVRFLNRARDIGSVMFQRDELRVDFDVILRCNNSVSLVEFVVGDQKAEFRCDGDVSTRMRWPRKEGQGASLSAYGKSKRGRLDRPGEWGIFELLEAPESTLPAFKGEDVLVFTYDLSKYNLERLPLKIRPVVVRGATAFFGIHGADSKFLGLLRAPDVLPPKRLFSGTGGCEHR